MSNFPSQHSCENRNPEQLITENLDVWTAAIQSKASSGRGSNKKQELYGIKKLRELILELAVRGLLVPQDTRNEPASVLVAKIAAEKEQLIKDGKLKKQKKSKPFDVGDEKIKLPIGWCKSDFGDITFNRDAERIPLSVSERNGRSGKYDYYGASGVIDSIDDFLFDKPLLLIGEDGANLVNRSTPIAFMAYGKYWVNNHAHVIDAISERFLKYLALYINSISLLPYITGMAQPKMNQAKMNSIPVLVPPEEEIPRVLAKVDELMALCDQLEQQTEASLNAHQTLVETLLKALLDAAQSRDDASAFEQAWQRIADHFDVLFTTEHSIDQLKQTILQLAVMGKLVPQDPNDEPACVLLEKIGAEKERLVREGKIKKQKKLPPISEEEKPFELPEGWEWSKFDDIAKNEKNALKAGPFGSALKKSMYVESGYKIYGQEQVIANDENIGDYFVGEEKYLSLESCKVQEGDILISLVGTIGKVLIISKNALPGIINPRLVKLSLYASICREYIRVILGSRLIQDELFEKSHGSTMNVLNLGLLRQLVLPLPPIAEQHKIVEKVDNLLAICDRVKKHIRESQSTQLHLADAMAEQAL